MNKHELHGGARHVGGKIEKAVGDVADRRDWQAQGVVDQVAGRAEHLFGRAQSIASDVADMTPGLIEDARTRIGDAPERSGDAARRGTRAATQRARGNEGVLVALAAALGGYAVGWLIHGRRG